LLARGVLDLPRRIRTDTLRPRRHAASAPPRRIRTDTLRPRRHAASAPPRRAHADTLPRGR